MLARCWQSDFWAHEKAERDDRGGTHEKQGKSPALYVCRKRTEFFNDRAGPEPIF